jgi:hypothetical protein
MDGKLHHQISILAAVKQTTILEEVNTAVAEHLQRENKKLKQAGQQHNGGNHHETGCDVSGCARALLPGEG